MTMTATNPRYRFLTKNFNDVVNVLVSDPFLRQELAAKISCRMIQHGSNIDSLPIEPKAPPITNSLQLIGEE